MYCFKVDDQERKCGLILSQQVPAYNSKRIVLSEHMVPITDPIDFADLIGMKGLDLVMNI
jgi:hypothetical protein